MDQPGVARAETRFRGVPTCHGQDKLEVGPEFPTSNRPSCEGTTRGSECGEQTPPGERSTRFTVDTAKRGQHTIHGTNVRGRCPRFSVMHRRRGGEARKRGTEISGSHARAPTVSEPRRRVPASCPFLRDRRHAPNQSAHDDLRSFRSRPLEPSKGPGPYVSGTMGTDDRNNPAYGISCRTRPIPIVGTRPERFTEQVPHGPLERLPHSRLTSEMFRHPNDGLGLKSGLIWGQLVTAPGFPETARRTI